MGRVSPIVVERNRTILIEPPKLEDELYAILTIMTHNPNHCVWCRAISDRILEHMDGIDA